MQVSNKKTTFGLIKCCERHEEVPFNFDQLESVSPEDLSVGDDVAFTVKWDIQKGKQIAIKSVYWHSLHCNWAVVGYPKLLLVRQSSRR